MTDPALTAIDWPAAEASLDTQGFVVLPKLLTPEACAATTALYDDEAGFRSRVVMQRHGYGQGEYRYFAYPLPPLVEALRTALYPSLAAVANRWQATLGLDTRFPAAHAAYLKQCHAAGQTKPTPLLLRYGVGDYNCLHQDRYGAELFPLQVAVLLAEPGRDFTGGEFVLTEQRPRRQSSVSVVPLRQGDAVVFAVNQRPAKGTRGPYRVTMKHGVSALLSGQRHTLGIIFHDAA